MDMFSNSPYSSGSDKPEYGSPSGVFGSDDEVKLASRNPKKKAGRKKFKETRHPVFRGIRMRNNDKWVCELREPTKQARIWLGTYPTAEMAARAHDVAALAFRGKAACLNFADSAWRLPSPASLDAKDIRKAASEAADMFRTTKKSVEASSRVEEEARDDQAIPEVSGGEVVDSNDVSGEDMMGSDWSGNMFSVDQTLSELLLDMAGGLLISPPPMGDYMSWGDVGGDGDGDVSLWSYSM